MTINLNKTTVTEWTRNRKRWEDTPLRDYQFTLKDKRGRDRRFHVSLQDDLCGEMPWESEDGHGPVQSGRYKSPGELRLDERTVYDLAEATRIARRDGWGFVPGGLLFGKSVTYGAKPTFFVWPAADPAGPRVFYDPDTPTGPAGVNAAIRQVYDHYRRLLTPRQLAALAARADYEYLLAWVENVWNYTTLEVCEIDDKGEQVSPGSEYLGGVESFATFADMKDYLEDMAQTCMDATDEAHCASDKEATLPRLQLNGGKTLAPRHRRANKAFKGAWMVADDEVWEKLDTDPYFEFDDASEAGGYCVVGDSKDVLLLEVVQHEGE